MIISRVGAAKQTDRECDDEQRISFIFIFNLNFAWDCGSAVRAAFVDRPRLGSI